MKLKEFGPGGVPGAPLDSANEFCKIILGLYINLKLQYSQHPCIFKSNQPELGNHFLYECTIMAIKVSVSMNVRRLFDVSL